jgi:hypothetical protein
LSEVRRDPEFEVDQDVVNEAQRKRLRTGVDEVDEVPVELSRELRVVRSQRQVPDKCEEVLGCWHRWHNVGNEVDKHFREASGYRIDVVDEWDEVDKDSWVRKRIEQCPLGPDGATARSARIALSGGYEKRQQCSAERKNALNAFETCAPDTNPSEQQNAPMKPSAFANALWAPSSRSPTEMCNVWARNSGQSIEKGSGSWSLRENWNVSSRRFSGFGRRIGTVTSDHTQLGRMPDFPPADDATQKQLPAEEDCQADVRIVLDRNQDEFRGVREIKLHPELQREIVLEQRAVQVVDGEQRPFERGQRDPPPREWREARFERVQEREGVQGERRE